jgi:hypothetical protein
MKFLASEVQEEKFWVLAHGSKNIKESEINNVKIYSVRSGL